MGLVFGGGGFCGCFKWLIRGWEGVVFEDRVYGSDSFGGSGEGTVSNPGLRAGFSCRLLPEAFAE
jgi:hypothetical protein